VYTKDRDALIVGHLKLGTAIAADFARAARARRIDWDDVLSAAALGLCRAAERWKPSAGRFSIYARKFVRGAIRDQLDLFQPITTRSDFSGVADHRPRPVPELEPVFPIRALTPDSECPPHGGITRPGSVFVCGVCWASAWDRHPDLQLSLRERLRLRSRRRYAAVIPLPKLETRRQRRLKKFGERRHDSA
jgi:hypothetical protein